MRTSKTTTTYRAIRSTLKGNMVRADNGLVYSLNQLTPGTWMLSDTRTTTTDPDWKVKVMKSLDATGEYFRRDTLSKPAFAQVDDSHTQSGIKFHSGRWESSFEEDLSSFVTNRTDAAVRDIALARLKRRIGNNVKQVNLLVPLVELRELRSLIKAIAYNGVDLAKALLDIKRSKGKSGYQYAAHAWLNWSFALKPTVLEAQEVLGTIEDFLAEANERKLTDYGAAKKQWNSGYKSTSVVGYYSQADKVTVMDHELSYRFTAGYKTPVRSANDYSAQEAFGLEIGAVVPALWELTYFSWLADYFSTIGAYLEDTFITDPVTTVYVVETRKYRCDADTTLSNGRSFANGGGYVSMRPRTGQCSVFEIQRTSHPNIPARQLRFKTADEIGKNAINKVLNLCSVAIGGRAFSGRIL